MRDEYPEGHSHPTDDESGCAPYESVGQTSGANVFFLHSDHLGSLRLVTNTQGSIVTNHKYLPYGEEIQPMRTLNAYRFAGYERDSESGKDYVRARYYTASQGRWLTPDRLGDGFTYASNRPVVATDPTGDYTWLITRCTFTVTNTSSGTYARQSCYQYAFGDDSSTWAGG